MSQLKEIKKHLLSGKSISPMMALNKFGCFRLAARIKNLRDEGMNIKSEVYRSKEYTYTKYKLVKDEIEMPIVFWLMTIENKRLREAALEAHENESFKWSQETFCMEVSRLSGAIMDGFTWSETYYEDEFDELHEKLIDQEDEFDELHEKLIDQGR